MKRGVIFFAILLLISISMYSLQADTNSSVTGKIITSDMAAGFGLNIFVTAAPALSIISPENNTYLTNNSLLLNYSVSPDANFTYYSLDSAANQTITSSVYFNTSSGSHVLFLYASNKYGNTTRNVSFFINLTKFIILNSKYNGTNKGNSTNFFSYSYETLQNLSNIILENNNYGKILFNASINVTDISGNELNLDSNTNISFNRIELNSTALPNFNSSATLSLYGLTFSNPRILRDGSVCPDSICTRESYLGNTLRFNVTGFSVYSSEETPAGVTPVTTPPAGGGSGGTYITPKVKSFTLSRDEIKTTVKQGRIVIEEIIITNKLNSDLDVSINISRIGNLVRVKDNSIHLAPKESKVITFEIIAGEDMVPNLYIGEIIIKAGGDEQNILTAIEVESSRPLFDVSVNIPSQFSYVMPDEKILGEIQVYNLGEINKEVDVNLEYKILDWRGNEISKESENIAVNTKVSFVKTFKIPSDAPYEKYAFYVKATYNQKVASGSAWFNVGKTPTIPFELATIALAILIAIVVIVILVKRKIKKQVKPIKRIDEKALKRANILRR